MKKRNIKIKKENNNSKDAQTKDQNNNRMKWPIITLITVCVIIFVLMIVFVIRTYTHYSELESHRTYFEQPNATIQAWMTIRSVVKHYNLTEEDIYKELNVSPGTLINELGIDNSTIVDKLTIKNICIKKHLDCNAVVNRLNDIRTK